MNFEFEKKKHDLHKTNNKFSTKFSTIQKLTSHNEIL